MKVEKGQRLCLRCTALVCPGIGGLTWAFGDCEECGHFGITTESQPVRDQAARQAGAENQGNLF